MAAAPHAVVVASGGGKFHGRSQVGFVSVGVAGRAFEPAVRALQIEERITEAVDDRGVLAAGLPVGFARSRAAFRRVVLARGPTTGLAALLDAALHFAEVVHGLTLVAGGWLGAAVPDQALHELVEPERLARVGIHGDQTQENGADLVVQNAPSAVLGQTHGHFHRIGADRTVRRGEARGQGTGRVFGGDLRTVSLEQIEARERIEVGLDVGRALRQGFAGGRMQRGGTGESVAHEEQPHAEIGRGIFPQHVGMAAVEFAHEGVLRGGQPGCASRQPVGQPCLDAPVLDGIDQTELDGVVVDLLGGDAMQAGQRGMRAFVQHDGREEFGAASEQVAFVHADRAVAHADRPTRTRTPDAHGDISPQRGQTGQAFQPGPHFLAKLRLGALHAASFQGRMSPQASAMRMTARSSEALSSCPR